MQNGVSYMGKIRSAAYPDHARMHLLNDATGRNDSMQKIAMKTPLVEMDGDEMTRVLWKWIKEMLLEPYIDLKTEYYDLGLPHRD